jgi:hypothetical protein
MVQLLRGQENDCVKVHSSHQEAREGEEALRVGKRPGSRRGADLLDLPLAGIALFCLGILLSFLATAATGGSSAPARTALGNVDGEALARLDKEASYPLTPAVQEARETEELSVRAFLLMSMLVVAVSSFFWRSGSSLLAANSSLKRGVSHSLGVLGGSWAAAVGERPSLGYSWSEEALCFARVGRSIDRHLYLEERSTG